MNRYVNDFEWSRVIDAQTEYAKGIPGWWLATQELKSNDAYYSCMTPEEM